jgi:limonene-1,2-epoxide hydrolase
MTETEQKNIEVVQAYFEACNTGSLDGLLATLAPEVVHYFLPPTLRPIHGAEHLARYWRKFKQTLDPVWAIDRVVAQGSDVVTEWSCLWTPAGTQRRRTMRGTEWYVMHDARIAEVRAYFLYDATIDSELHSFPYVTRGYLRAESA